MDVDKICIVVAFLSYLTLVKFGMICVTLLSCTILSVFFLYMGTYTDGLTPVY